jgi:hypothetical protein
MLQTALTYFAISLPFLCTGYFSYAAFKLKQRICFSLLPAFIANPLGLILLLKAILYLYGYHTFLTYETIF